MTLPESYLAEIHINALPGIDRPFSITGIKPGLNIVTGPNGSGKTSLCRAVLSLLWGNSKQRDDSIRAVWLERSSNGVSRLQAARNAGGTIWTRDALQLNVLQAPAYLAECFIIRMEDLLPAIQADSSLTNEIGRELNGGFDLNAVYNLPVFKPHNSHMLDLKRALEPFEIAQGKLRLLKSRDDNLTVLKQQLDHERRIAANRPLIEMAAELLDLRDQMNDLGKQLSTFPAGMNAVTEGDSQLLESLEAAILTTERELEGFGGELDRAERALAESRLFSTGTPSDAEIEALVASVSRLQEVDRDIRGAELAAATAAARLENAAAYLAGDSSEEDHNAGPAEAHAMDEAEEFLADALVLHNRIQGLKQASDGLRTQLIVTPQLPLVDARRLLVEWLAADAARLPAVNQRLALLFVLISIAGAVATALTRSLWPAVTVVLGVAGIWLSLQRKTAEPDTESPRRKYIDLKVEPPERWDKVSIESRIDGLNTEIATANQAARMTQVVSVIDGQIEAAEAAEGDHASRRARFTEANRINIDHLSAAMLLRAAGAHQKASAALAAAQAELDLRKCERDKVLDKLNEGIGHYTTATCEDAESAAAAVSSLKSEVSAFRNARDAMERIGLRRSDAVIELQSRKRSRAEILVTRQSADLAEVVRKESLRPHWTALTTKRDAAGQRADTLRDRLTPELLNIDAAALETERARSNDAEHEIDALLDSIKGIEAEVAHAMQGSALADLTATVDLERAKAAGLRSESMLAEAGLLLLEETARGLEARAPAVLQRADSLFQTFTNGAYRLAAAIQTDRSAKGRQAPVQAILADTGRTVGISQLSGGTRVQLLMAVRIAFAEQAPTFVAPPIVLDEALSNSDPERFSAVAGCLQSLAQSGRQIFYLTSDPAEAERLQTTASGVGIHRIDMLAARSANAYV